MSPLLAPSIVSSLTLLWTQLTSFFRAVCDPPLLYIPSPSSYPHLLHQEGLVHIWEKDFHITTFKKVKNSRTDQVTPIFSCQSFFRLVQNTCVVQHPGQVCSEENNTVEGPHRAEEQDCEANNFKTGRGIDQQGNIHWKAANAEKRETTDTTAPWRSSCWSSQGDSEQTNASFFLSYRAQTWRAAPGTYRHACGPLFHGQECKMFCKLQPFCVKRTHQALTNPNVSYSFLFWIQQRLIGSWTLFPALCHLTSLAVGRWLI